MKIEVGDTVQLNNGEVDEVGRMYGDDPRHVNPLGQGPFVINEFRYHEDGRFGCHGFKHPLSVKRIVQKASRDTLANLQVGPGDVVEFTDTRGVVVSRYTIQGWANGRCYHMGQKIGGRDGLSKAPRWRVVHRASDDTQSSQEGEPKMWRDMTDKEKANVPADVINDPANPLRIPWGEWSKAAKGAVLLAHHEGEVIENNATSDGIFFAAPPVWDAGVAYRIKPEPVRETVTMHYDANHRITFDLIDGEPDCEKCDTCGSAKHVNMEKL